MDFSPASPPCGGEGPYSRRGRLRGTRGKAGRDSRPRSDGWTFSVGSSDGAPAAAAALVRSRSISRRRARIESPLPASPGASRGEAGGISSRASPARSSPRKGRISSSGSLPDARMVNSAETSRITSPSSSVPTRRASRARVVGRLGTLHSIRCVPSDISRLTRSGKDRPPSRERRSSISSTSPSTANRSVVVDPALTASPAAGPAVSRAREDARAAETPSAETTRAAQIRFKRRKSSALRRKPASCSRGAGRSASGSPCRSSRCRPEDGR
jgi:hypothetical protein